MSIHSEPIWPLNQVDCVWQTHALPQDVEDACGDLFAGFFRAVWLISADRAVLNTALSVFTAYAGIWHLEPVVVPCSHKDERPAWKFLVDVDDWDGLFKCQPGKLADFDVPDECDFEHFEFGRIVGAAAHQDGGKADD